MICSRNAVISTISTLGLGDVVEAARNPPKATGSYQSVKSLIDRSARSQVGEVLRGPDAGLGRCGNAVSDGRWNAGC
jgi:hypothetical protein